jgi:hypothetical protein
MTKSNARNLYKNYLLSGNTLAAKNMLDKYPEFEDKPKPKSKPKSKDSDE